jgi:phosphatidate cytidylyltransferase
MKRVATALVLIPTVVWLILAGPDWAFTAVLVLIALLCYREYHLLIGPSGVAGDGIPGMIPGMIAGVVLILAPEPGAMAVLVALTGMVLALRAANLSDAMGRAAMFTLGVIYIFGAWRCAAELRAINHHWLMFAMLLSWAGDTAAFGAGRAFGRHKLAPQVSPGKTWEGAAGSVAGGMLAGGIYAHYLLPTVALAMVLALAAAGNIAGQLGDLCESALKRGVGVKDSGSSLPGHGGWLDRVDSTLFTVPVVYVILKLLPPG